MPLIKFVARFHEVEYNQHRPRFEQNLFEKFRERIQNNLVLKSYKWKRNLINN